MKKGPYEVTSSKTVYKNPWMEVREDRVVRPDGKEGMFGVVNLGGGVTVVAVNEQQEIVLIKEYYYALDKYLLQTPAGGIEVNEAPLAAARRELEEETGYIATTWTELGMIHPLTMVLNSPAYLFLATGLSKKGKGEEGIEIVTLPFEKAYEMVMESTISHGPSAVAILKTQRLLETKEIRLDENLRHSRA